MKKILFTYVGLLAVGLGVTVLLAAPMKIELPPETGVFKAGKGAELANAQCLVCHSVEYVSTQPALSRTAWAASVKKMREKYGALVADDHLEALLDYLTINYGVGGTNSAPTVVANAASPSAANGQPVTGSSLALKHNCLSCHTVSAKLIGPAYKDIAEKYRTDVDAKKKIAEQIHKGGSGKWGAVIMPPFPQINEEETKILTEWIMSRK
jgi:cytochrome c551/c552